MRQKIDCLLARLCVPLFLFIFLSFSANAQKVVTGKVTNAKDNSAVGFATITVKGTTTATLTDVNGNFTLNLPAGKKSLVISSVGFATTEVDGSSGNVSVKLTESTSSLDEIVVTGYTAQRKKEITGAVSVVNVKDLKQVPVSTGEEALQGRASGLTIISSGQPGAASDIRIRGITTFGDNRPLIIIDGVRQDGGLRDINPNDIESLQVLKDASAAIYGVAGANGVIIVTTRRGGGKPKVSYDAYYGVTTPGPGYDMANTQQEANAKWQQNINSGLKPGDNGWGSVQYGNGTNPVIPDYITPKGYVLCNCATDSNFVSPSLYNIDTYQITKANKQGTDWYKEITRNANVQSHNISVSSGSDKNSYFFSLNYLDQQGIAKYQYEKRYSVRANTQFTIKDKIRVGENAYIFYKRNPIFNNQQEGSPFSTAFREDAIIPVYDIEGNFAGSKSADLGNAQNVFANIYRTKDNKNNNWDINGNVFAEVDFLRHFTVRTSFGGSIDNNYYYNFNYVAYENAEGNTGTNSFSEGAGYNSSWTYTNTLRYANTFGDHNLTVLLGTEAVNFYGRFLSGTRSDYFSQNPDYWVLDRGAATQSNSGNAYQSSLWSQFAKLEYGYKGKYLLNGSIRRDAASVFSDGYQRGYFPGVSAGWVISQENFLKSVAWLNSLKLRYSWGKLGTTSNVQSTNPFNLYSQRLGKSAYDIFGNSNTPYVGFYRSNIGNVSTTFEGDIISNYGLDATLFNNKLDLSVEYYKKKVSGLLYSAQGPTWDVIAVGDGTRPFVNIADNQSTGIDATVTYHGTVNKDFKFDITGIFSSYKSKIISIPGSGYFDGPTLRNVILQRYQEGHPFGEFYGYQVEGLFQSDEEVSKSPLQTDAGPGLFKYKDVDRNDTIDARDRTFIGNPNPDFTYGLNLSFSYKNLDFSAFFFGSQGNEIFNQTLYYTDFPDFFKGGIRREAALNSWTPENTNTDIPKLRNTGGFSSDGVTNSYFISNGSYLRCKQIQVGYTIPSSTLARIGVDRFRIYVQASNLFTITKYNGLDPELQTPPVNNGITSAIGFGVDQGNYPHSPAYLVGVSLGF